MRIGPNLWFGSAPPRLTLAIPRCPASQSFVYHSYALNNGDLAGAKLTALGLVSSPVMAFTWTGEGQRRSNKGDFLTHPNTANSDFSTSVAPFLASAAKVNFKSAQMKRFNSQLVPSQCLLAIGKPPPRPMGRVPARPRMGSASPPRALIGNPIDVTARCWRRCTGNAAASLASLPSFLDSWFALSEYRVALVLDPYGVMTSMIEASI